MNSTDFEEWFYNYRMTSMVRMMSLLVIVLLLLMIPMPLFSRSPEVSEKTYRGMCDASAVVGLDGGWFVVADDENNVLRIYHNLRPGMPEGSLDLSRFLDVSGKSPEADLEGAARLGDQIYWISSHGCNAKGKQRPNRHRFFATAISHSSARPMLVPIGTPYRHLVRDLIRDPRLRAFNLEEASKRAPKEFGALNIEGLSATPDGHLLIGFRNPLPQGKALIVPLLNPKDLLQNRPARFGEPILLDLKGNGIRDIVYHRGRYILIAGSYRGGGRASLYSWQGNGSLPQLIQGLDFTGLNPEGLVFFDEKDPQRCEIVSDDGNERVDRTPCKSVKDPEKKSFRTITVILPPSPGDRTESEEIRSKIGGNNP